MLNLLNPELLHSFKSIEELESFILHHYSFGNLNNLQLVCNGLNDTYSFNCNGILYYLRIYKFLWKSIDEIKEELFFLSKLKSEGIVSVESIQSNQGSYFIPIFFDEGQRYLSVFNAAEGTKGSETGNEFYLLGAKLGQFHHFTKNLSLQYRKPIDFKYLIANPLKIINRFLDEESDDFSFLNRLITTYKVELDFDSLHGVIHSDVHFDNVFFNDAEVSLIDFDCCGYGLLNYDLAVIVFFTTLVGFSKETIEGKLKRLDKFFKGYQEYRVLSDNDITNVWRLVLIRHVWQLGILSGKAKFTDEEHLYPDLFKRANNVTRNWMKYFDYKLNP